MKKPLFPPPDQRGGPGVKVGSADHERLKELLRKRLADTAPSLMLARLDYFMTHCWKCEAKVEWSAAVCERCGEELMEHGKH